MKMNFNLTALITAILVSSCATKTQQTKNKQIVNHEPIVYDSLKMVGYANDSKERAGDIRTYILKHLKYPDGAKKQKIEGSVLLRYQVEADSTIKIKVVNSLTEECDREAVRVLKSALLHHFDVNFVGEIVLTSVPFRLPRSAESSEK